MSVDQFFYYFFYTVLSVLALITFAFLVRSMMGPTFFDRILAVNNISTLVTIMICILAVVQQEHYLMDVAMIYSMLGFVTVIIVCKTYLRSHDKEGQKDILHHYKKQEEEEL